MKSLLTALIVSVILVSCGGEQKPVPRRTAYPRAPHHDTAMIQAAEAPIYFDVNAAANVTSTAPGWLNVAYPAYDAVMYVTFTPVDETSIDTVRVNRMERLLLNAGGAPGERREFMNEAGYDVMIFTARGTATPVQFLATDGESSVVSGAVYFSDPRAAAAVDSLDPYVRAIEGDVMRSMKTLGSR
ncbi:MAG: hypothetical protein K2M00_06300 [Muribaculaceae bacterium]|nr:hypothetical protein [Muribaculaceae bacterium]